jgi:proline racemase
MGLREFGDMANFAVERSLETVDSHTCGQPTRVILDGTGITPGSSPQEARKYLAEKVPWVRRLAILEPRGHRSMFGAALIPPGPGQTIWGVVFMDAATYPDMCGHATIGTATTLVELGLVKHPQALRDGTFSFAMNSPAGTLELEATTKDGRCESISFRTPLAYFVGSVELTLDNKSQVQVDIAYGGQYYAFLPASAVGLAIQPDIIDALIAAAGRVRPLLAQHFKVVDKRTGLVPEVGNVVWTAPPEGQGADARNVPVSQAGSFDRSPCGTATCARMATLVAQKQLAVGESFVNESILGTRYYGKVIAANTEVENGIVPQVTGSAWLTAHSRLLLDERDPLSLGYLIGGGKAVI